jgi:aspartate aminotransferase
MPNISQRGQAMPASPIRKLVPFAEIAEQNGHKVYYLNIGQPDIPSPLAAMDVLRHHEIKILAYSHSAGFLSYRKKLVDYYAKHAIHITPQEMIVTTGGSEALAIAMGAILDPGDEIIIPEPYYANYLGFATGSGAVVVPVVSSIESGFQLPSMLEIEALITPKTKALLLCNPGNPTGKLYSKKELLQVRKIALKHDIFIIADEVYREFTYDRHKHTSVMSLEGMEEQAVLIDSVSKRYSMCGARIGLLASKNIHFMASAMRFAQARLSPPTFEQIAAETALDTPDSYFKEVNVEYTKRRDYLIARLNDMDGVFCPKPAGAFYCMAQLPVENSDHFCQWMLESFDHEGNTVMMAPAGGFYTDSSMGAQQVRLAYVLDVEDLTIAMDALEVGLKVYPYRTS